MNRATKTAMKSEAGFASIPAAFAIERPALKAGVTEPRHVTEHLQTLLRAQLADLTTGLEGQAPKTTGTFGGFGSAAALERHISEWKKGQLAGAARTMDFTVPLGVRMIAPPYDHGWAVGAGLGTAKFDGAMLAFGEEGFSASGASVVLSSPTEVLASVTPEGTFDFAWVSFDNYPSLLSRGGLGILVYEGGNPTPLLVRQAVLWSLSGVSQFSSDKGSGQYADAVAAMTSFGPVRLAPALINMRPGVSYEVWMWCWTVGQNQKGTAFLSDVRCNIPVVLVDAGPPIVIH
jgi:hypothetical protein